MVRKRIGMSTQKDVLYQKSLGKNKSEVARILGINLNPLTAPHFRTFLPLHPCSRSDLKSWIVIENIPTESGVVCSDE
jgi:hypothetical protein